jgi:hypothetical protein
MKKMYFINQDNEKSFEWVIWGEPEECCLFGRTFNSKGWAIRKAKKRIEEGDKACVVKRGSGAYSVMFGNGISSWLLSMGKL